jgi:hypothetical protein
MGNLTPYIKSSVKTAGGKKTFKFDSKPAITGAGVSLIKTQFLKKTLPNFVSDFPTHTSYLGTPVYDFLVLGELNETNTYIDILGEGVEYAPIRFDEVLLDVSLAKNIIATAIQGRNKTIKQYISDGDYVILITGRISGKWNGSTWSKNGQYYPEQEIQNLINICKAGYMIPVTSNFLNNIFGIEFIVIQDYRLAQSEGGRYSQAFELNCLSDQDVILEFTEEDVNNEETLDYILNV